MPFGFVIFLFIAGFYFLQQIPSLNDRPLHAFTDGSLVRYRCMIQDQFEPEYYLNTYQLVNTTTGAKVRRPK